jgi:hypothetical protein
MAGGTGDAFRLAHVIDTQAPGFRLCFAPLVGNPIAQGNIVIKTTGILP